MPETLTLDPEEWDPSRTELPLNELGLEVLANGLDYGESSATAEKIRKMIGEGITDRKWPNVDCTIPLVVKAESDVSLAEVAQKLEQKAGLIQRQGGSIRRDFDVDGKFAGSVMCPITTIGLPPLQGWMMVHRQAAPGVILKINRHPIWYATVEVEGEEVSASDAHDLQCEVAKVLGSAPGLIRLRIKNENEEGDWGGLICAIESRDYSEGETALPAYAAEDLTLHGPAKVLKTGEGTFVKATGLPAGMLAILSSKLDPEEGSDLESEGHMTHRGTRRVYALVFDPSEKTDAERLEEWRNGGEEGARPEPAQPRLQLEWRPLGASLWETNPAVVAPVVGHWQIVDLGEAHPRAAVLGDDRWQFRISVEANGEGDEISIKRVYPLSTEQMFVLSSPEAIPASDQFDISLPGTVTQLGEAQGGGGVEWKELSKLKAEDGSRATVTLNDEAEESKEAELRNLGFDIPSNAIINGMQAVVTGVKWPDTAVAPSLTFQFNFPEDTTYKLKHQPGESGQVIFGHPQFTKSGITPADLNDEDFGGNLWLLNGPLNTGENKFEVDAVTFVVYYTEVANENKVCFASRTVEARTDGIFRQHPEDDVWGQLVPEGFLPYAPPSGLEELPMRVTVIPTQGNLGKEADTGSNDFSLTPIYRPGYLFAREAAS